MASLANVGQTDKVIRIVAGLGLGAAAFFSLGGFSTTLGIVAVIVAAVLLVTGLVNFCPAYKILGLNSGAK